MRLLIILSLLVPFVSAQAFEGAYITSGTSEYKVEEMPSIKKINWTSDELKLMKSAIDNL